MNDASSIGVQQDVLAVPISESMIRNSEPVRDKHWSRTPR